MSLLALQSPTMLAVGDEPMVTRLARHLAQGRGSAVQYVDALAVTDQTLRAAGVVVIEAADHDVLAESLRAAAVPVCVVHAAAVEPAGVTTSA